VRRLFAFVALSGTNESVFVSIGIPTEVAFAKAQQTMIRNLILLAVVTMLALATAWILGDVFVLQNTKSLVDTTQQLAKGELKARTKIAKDTGEFGLLAIAIDEMAEALSERETERDLAENNMHNYAADLERSNRDLLDFANIASHDMQEPLRKIQIFGDLLQSRYASVLDEQGRGYIQRMQGAAYRMQNLLLGLLAYSQISTKGEPFSTVDLDEVVKNVLTHLEVLILEQNAEISVENLPSIQGDETQMHQLMQNLISNAIKFRAPNRAPVIHISCPEAFGQDPFTSDNSQCKPACQIHIRDNGIGFDERYKEKIFLPFQRLYGRSKYDGTGLGLAICEKIVTRHGGSITAQSQPGQGSTFIISLPKQQSPGGVNS
jgi:light-regulated signal transduction histidine kinase (bacteriophytochrome)